MDASATGTTAGLGLSRSHQTKDIGLSRSLGTVRRNANALAERGWKVLELRECEIRDL